MIVIECIAVAISAWVFFDVLTAPGAIFSGWYEILERLSVRAMWLAKPLGYCGTCFAGQVGLWYYLIECRDEYSVIKHGIFVCCTIFFFLIIKKWAKKNELN